MLKKHYRPPDQISFNLKVRSKTFDTIRIPKNLVNDPVESYYDEVLKAPSRSDSISGSQFSNCGSSGYTSSSSYKNLTDPVLGENFKNLSLRKTRSRDSIESSSASDSDRKPTQCRRSCRPSVSKKESRSQSPIKLAKRTSSFKDFSIKLFKKDKNITRESSYVTFDDNYSNFDKFISRKKKNVDSLTLPRNHRTSKHKISRVNYQDKYTPKSEHTTNGWTSHSSNEFISDNYRPPLLTLPVSTSVKASKFVDSENGILKSGKIKLSKSVSANGSTSMKNEKPVEFKLSYQDSYCTLTSSSSTNSFTKRSPSSIRSFTKTPIITRAKSFNDKRNTFSKTLLRLNSCKSTEQKWV